MKKILPSVAVRKYLSNNTLQLVDTAPSQKRQKVFLMDFKAN